MFDHVIRSNTFLICLRELIPMLNPEVALGLDYFLLPFPKLQAIKGLSLRLWLAV